MSTLKISGRKSKSRTSLTKANPYRDGSSGRFTTGGGGAVNVTNVQTQTYPSENGETSSRITGEFKTKNGDTVKLIHDNTKLTDGTIEMETVANLVVPGGVKRIGYLNASRDSKVRPEYGAIIDSVSVDTEYRRQGVASAMLGFARTHAQDGIKIDHSFSLTDDAKAWSSVFKANPYRDASTGRFTTGGGGAGIKPPEPGSGGYITADEATLTEGTFDEETQYEELATTYQERYGIDKDGNVVGVTKEEVDALDHYSQNGYKTINAHLRGQDIRTDLDPAEAKAIIENDESLYLSAIDEWSENNETGSMDMTEAELEDAIFQYATNHGAEMLDRINTGNTPMALATKREVAALDSLIAASPVAFGDKPLYRVFDDKVLKDLKPGDVVTDKGFLSTTRINVSAEDQNQARTWLSGIDTTPDTAGIILPNKGRNGKGIAVDAFRTAIDKTNTVSDTEKEILLPRNTPLRFLGYAMVGMEDRAPVFERLD